MKKFVVLAVLTAAGVVLSQERASAWHDCSFSAGISFSCKGGGNCLLWGLASGQQAPPWYNWGGGYPGFAGGYAGFDGGYAGYAGDYGAYGGSTYAGTSMGSTPATGQAAAPSKQTQPVGYQPYYYGQAGVQPVGYYPYGGYGYGQAPSYWYGR